MTNLELHPIKFQYCITICLFLQWCWGWDCLMAFWLSYLCFLVLKTHTVVALYLQRSIQWYCKHRPASPHDLICFFCNWILPVVHFEIPNFSYGSWFLTNKVFCVGTSQGFQWQQHYNLASHAYFTMASYMMAGSGQVSGSQSRGKGSSDQVWRQVGGGLWCYHKDPWRDIPTAFSCDPWGQGFYVRSSPWLGVNPGI